MNRFASYSPHVTQTLVSIRHQYPFTPSILFHPTSRSPNFHFTYTRTAIITSLSSNSASCLRWSNTSNYFLVKYFIISHIPTRHTILNRLATDWRV